MPKQLFSYCLSDKNTTKQETVIQAQCPITMESNANNAASLVLFFMFTFIFFPKASRKQQQKKPCLGFATTDMTQRCSLHFANFKPINGYIGNNTFALKLFHVRCVWTHFLSILSLMCGRLCVCELPLKWHPMVLNLPMSS